MEPQIQYATTSDGVAIAWCEAGDGWPLITTWVPFGGVDGRRELFPSWVDGMTRRFRFVWYDARGVGLSDRSAVDFSMDAMQRDLDAVIDRVGAATVALGGFYDSVPIMVTYAAAHPERVSHLVLGDGWSRFSDQQQSTSYKTMMLMMDADWLQATETLVRVFLQIDDSQRAVKFAEHIRASIEPDTFRASQLALTEWGVEHLLSQVATPTLVLHNRGNPWQPVSASQRITAGIRGAQFRVIDDIDYERVAPLIEEFILGSASPAEQAGLLAGTAVILFADIADSTALTERLGDAAFREKARALDASLREAITSNGGTAIEGKLLGDGVLAVFGAAREAIACAQEMHRLAAGAGNAGPSDQQPATSDLLLHVGIHAGDVIREEGNVYGGAVNIASRVAGAAAPGETLVSGTVRDLARTSAGVSFEDRGERELKGVSEPVRLWAVRGA